MYTACPDRIHAGLIVEANPASTVSIGSASEDLSLSQPPAREAAELRRPPARCPGLVRHDHFHRLGFALSVGPRGLRGLPACHLVGAFAVDRLGQLAAAHPEGLSGLAERAVLGDQ